MNTRLGLAAALVASGLCTTCATEYSCDRSKNFVPGLGYSQISLTDGCRGPVCDANPKYGMPNDPLKALSFCEDQCTARAGCTGFFFQTHPNGHEICGFFNTEVDPSRAVWHGHRNGAVCVPKVNDDDGDEVPDPDTGATEYSCDWSKNFVPGQGYGQISLTDGCRGPVCDANPRYGEPNDPNRAVAWCEKECLGRGDGCTGFFFQTHPNGHEICGFFNTEVDPSKAVWSGGRNGAVCVPKVNDDDGDEVPDPDTIPHPDYVGPGGCTSDSVTFRRSEPVSGAGMSGCRDLCASHTACVGYTTPALPTGDCFYYTDLAFFRRQPHHVDVVPPVWPPLDDPEFSCDVHKNFVNGHRYSQVSLTDYCRGPVCDANPKYGALNDPQRAIRYCKDRCTAGCTGFFFQTHGNGHEICGFFHSDVNQGDAVWHGHRNGALCVKNPIEDDFVMDVIRGPRRLDAGHPGGYCEDFLGVPSQYADAFAPGMTIRVSGVATRAYRVTRVAPPGRGSISQVSRIYVDTRSLGKDMGCAGHEAVVTTNCRSVERDCEPSRDALSTVAGSDGSRDMTCYLHHQRHGSTRFTGLERHDDHYEDYETIMGTAGRAPLLPAPTDAPRPPSDLVRKSLLRHGRSKGATPRAAVAGVGGLMDVPLKNGNFGGGTAVFKVIMDDIDHAPKHFRELSLYGWVKEAMFRWVTKAIKSNKNKRCQKSRFQGCCSWSAQGDPQVCGPKCHNPKADLYNYCHLSPTKCYGCKGRWLDPAYDSVATPPWGEGEGQVPAECPSGAEFEGHVPENDYMPCAGILTYDCYTSTTMDDICSTDSGECIRFAFDSYEEFIITLLGFIPESFGGWGLITGKAIRSVIKRPMTKIVINAEERNAITDALKLLSPAIDHMTAGLQEWINDQLITVTLQPIIHQASRLIAMEGLANEEPKESWGELWESLLQDVDPTGILRIRDAMSSDACDEISPPYPRDQNGLRLEPDGLCLIGFAEDDDGICLPSECDRDAFRLQEGPPYEVFTMCKAPLWCGSTDWNYWNSMCRSYDVGYGVAWFATRDSKNIECHIFKEKVQQVAQKVPNEQDKNVDPDRAAICLSYEAIPDFRYTNQTKVKVKCNIILDGKLEGVWYNDVNLTSVVKGDFNNPYKLKSVQFDAVPWEAYLTVTGKAVGATRPYCSAAGFQISCDNGVTTRSDGWESAAGRGVLTGAAKQGMGNYWSSPCASDSDLFVEDDDLAALWGADHSENASFRKKM